MVHRLTNNLEKLLEAGISPAEAVDVANGAAEIYDSNRKLKGAHSGALGYIGYKLYKMMSWTADYDPDLEAFSAFRPYSLEGLASRAVASRSAVGPAFNRLVDHGFVETRRVGRGFTCRLLIPEVSLIELGRWWISQQGEPGSIAHDFCRPMGNRLLSMFPSASPSNLLS
ncbi:MAG: hypothetical protein ABIQ32_00445 [Sphingomicrobium sp.]